MKLPLSHSKKRYLAPLALASLVTALGTARDAFAQTDPDCQDQNLVPAAQFSSFVPQSVLSQFLTALQTELDNHFSVQIGPNIVQDGVSEETLLVQLPPDFVKVLQFLNLSAPSSLTIPFTPPSKTIPPFTEPYSILFDSVSVTSVTVGEQTGSTANGISLTVGFSAAGTIPSSTQTMVDWSLFGQATVLFQQDPVSQLFGVTVTNVSTQSSLTAAPGECALLTLELLPIGCAGADGLMQAWANSNLDSTLQETLQTALSSFMSQGTTQSEIMSVMDVLATIPPVSPVLATAAGIPGNLGSILAGGGNLSNPPVSVASLASGTSSLKSDFLVYPTSLYVDSAGNLCYQGELNPAGPQTLNFSQPPPPPLGSQFGPGNPDPCAAIRATVLAEQAKPSSVSAATLAANIASLASCEQPVCNVSSATAPVATQFCAQAWDLLPTPTCTATWSCYSPQYPGASQVAISCDFAYPDNGIAVGQFGFQVFRGLTLLNQTPQPVTTPTFIDLLPATTEFPDSLTYFVFVVPDVFEAPTDSWVAPFTVTAPVDALNSCACEPMTCEALSESYPGQQACGTLETGCGGTVDCGTCASGAGACIENLCGGPPKQPKPPPCKGTTCM
jgi:hypothetical protein